LVKIGEDVSEQLDVIPAQFIVHRHIRPQYACRSCDTVDAAPIPPAVIDGGMASVGLLVWLIIGKYLDHLPLYRLEQIAARSGVNLARSTLAEWVGRIGVALQPLADRLAALLLEQDVLHADETPVAQLDPGSGRTAGLFMGVLQQRAEHRTADRGVRLSNQSRGRACAELSGALERRADGGRLWRLQSVVRPGRHGVGLPGACAAEVLRPECGTSECDRAGGARPNRGVVCHRSPGP
jgi:transposase